MHSYIYVYTTYIHKHTYINTFIMHTVSVKLNMRKTLVGSFNIRVQHIHPYSRSAAPTVYMATIAPTII
jgi:hypothetical protein